MPLNPGIDTEDSLQRDQFRVLVTERLTRVEGQVCAIAKDIAKNNELTADVFDVLRGLRTMGKLLIWIASVTGAVTVCWAAFVWIAKQAA
jgi:hypothetical protein